jgi:hypothetical protein
MKQPEQTPSNEAGHELLGLLRGAIYCQRKMVRREKQLQDLDRPSQGDKTMENLTRAQGELDEEIAGYTGKLVVAHALGNLEVIQERHDSGSIWRRTGRLYNFKPVDEAYGALEPSDLTETKLRLVDERTWPRHGREFVVTPIDPKTLEAQVSLQVLD